MASAGGCVEEPEMKKTISDYLNDGDDEPAVFSPSPPAPCYRLPRFTWPRLVKLGRRTHGRKEAAAEKSHGASAVPSGWKAESSSGPTDIAAGLTVLLLLSKTCVELNKMAEARAAMEMLLKEIRAEVIRKSTHDAPRTCCHNSTNASSCTTDTFAKNHIIASSAMDQVASCEESSEEVLEEEFELNSDTEQKSSESSDDEFIEFRGGFGDNLDEVAEDEDDDEDGDRHDGVSAVELERRLHELLHQRNQERIQELESALRSAKKKLLEKEMEVLLWKDTASLAFRHDNGLQ